MADVLAGSLTTLLSGIRLYLTVEDREVVVLEHAGAIYAFSNVCLHQGGPVGEGILIGRVESEIDAGGCWISDRFSTDEIHLVCPWHGWEYELRSGRAAGSPERALRRYETRIEGDAVYVTG